MNIQKTKNIILYIANLKVGGAERVVSTLSLNLPDHINRTVVISDIDNVCYDYKGTLLDLKTPQHLKWLYKIYPIHKLRKIKKENHIDATISFIDGSNLKNIYSQILSKQKGKIIISVRNYPSKKDDELTKGLIKLFYNHADWIVAITKSMKWDLVNNFYIDESKIKVIYNPCDVNWINQMANEEIKEKEYKMIFSDSGPVIINVANFKESGQKGQWHLIRSFKKIVEEVPDAKLVFIGEGKLESYLKNLTKHSNLEKNIFFVGHQNNPFNFLRKGDIYVLSSLFEGLPNSILEAMACGLPVVSTDCPSGPREILAPDTDFKKILKDNIEHAEYGVLTPVCDGKLYSEKDPLTNEEKLLADSIIGLLNDSELLKHYQNQSKKRANDFKPEEIVDEWLELIY